MNREMVIHGKTGLLASTPAQWSQAVATLAADPALRARMGAAGREMVKRQYSVSRWAPEFAALIDRLPHELARPALVAERFRRTWSERPPAWKGPLEA
jgi:glycosyltransferase involved in cell wall biosynthesis